MSKITCRKCGHPFLTEKTYEHLSKIAREKGLTNFEGSLSLCLECKLGLFSEKLVGSDFKEDYGQPIQPVGSAMEAGARGCAVGGISFNIETQKPSLRPFMRCFEETNPSKRFFQN